MALLTLDTNTSARVWDAIIPLEGVEYLFEFYWSTREGRWYINIRNQNGTVLAAAIAVVVAPAVVPTGVTYKGLLRRFAANGNVPPGRLYAIDMTGQDDEVAQPSDLGTRVPLLYITSDEF